MKSGLKTLPVVPRLADCEMHMILYSFIWLFVVWLSGNALASINVVALHQTRLVPG